MKAIILNSGTGSRMGNITANQPKCLTEIYQNDTILARQLRILTSYGIQDIVITTGKYDSAIRSYVNNLNIPAHFSYVFNERYSSTNYIYSIYCAKDLLDDDILLLHGDLVFESSIIDNMLKDSRSCMTISSTRPIPQKDFKAVITNNVISRIGVDFFDNAYCALPLYKLNRYDWQVWLKEIELFCHEGQVNCYAENAYNCISSKCNLFPLDIKNSIAYEIDTPEDLATVNRILMA